MNFYFSNISATIFLCVSPDMVIVCDCCEVMKLFEGYVTFLERANVSFRFCWFETLLLFIIYLYYKFI